MNVELARDTAVEIGFIHYWLETRLLNAPRQDSWEEAYKDIFEAFDAVQTQNPDTALKFICRTIGEKLRLIIESLEEESEIASA